MLTVVARRSAVPLLFVLFAIPFLADTAERDCFSWMDPEQYFSFADAIHRGAVPEGGFDVPTLFPWAVSLSLAVERSVPSALRTNLVFALVLVFAVAALARRIAPGAGPPAAAVLLFSPLLTGLSRELYIEFALTALVTLQYCLWLRTDRFSRPAANALFALCFAVGMLFKMTWPIYFVGAVVVEAILLFRSGHGGRIVVLGAVTVLPAVAALGAVRLFFEHSFEYYLSMGNTKIPLMSLIGPEKVFSISSFLYYPAQIARWGFGPALPAALLPFLLLLFGKGRGDPREGIDGDRSDAALRRVLLPATWLIVPAAILFLQPVKEPRHIAPALPAAVLLVVAAAGALKGVVARRTVFAVLLAAAAGEYILVVAGVEKPPYRLAGKVGAGRIESLMLNASPGLDAFTSPSGRIDRNGWKYDTDIALSGFTPDEALALAWRFAPAVTVDLDGGEWSVAADTVRAFERFEDLFFLEAVNIYNRRCRWPRALRSLRRGEAAAADFMIVKSKAAAPEASPPPPFVPAGEVEGGGGNVVRVWARRQGDSPSLRERYALRYLARRADLSGKELNTVCFSLFLDGRIGGRIPERETILREFPPRFIPGTERRNIYWIGRYADLVRRGEESYRQWIGGGGGEG